jgi:hypothetical protein
MARRFAPSRALRFALLTTVEKVWFRAMRKKVSLSNRRFAPWTIRDKGIFRQTTEGTLEKESATWHSFLSSRERTLCNL